MTSFSHFLKKPDVGIFIFRLLAGILITIYGVRNLMAGSSNWAHLGGVMDHVGIHFAYVFWGFAAACAQALGGLCFLLGLFFRPACFFLALTMGMAVLFHWMKGDDMLSQGGSSLMCFFVFLSYLFIGPGSLSVMKD